MDFFEGGGGRAPRAPICRSATALKLEASLFGESPEYMACTGESTGCGAKIWKTACQNMPFQAIWGPFFGSSIQHPV